MVTVQGLEDNQAVRLSVLVSHKKEHPLMRFAGILSNDEAHELSKIVEDEFGRVSPDIHRVILQIRSEMSAL